MAIAPKINATEGRKYYRTLRVRLGDHIGSPLRTVYLSFHYASNGLVFCATYPHKMGKGDHKDRPSYDRNSHKNER